MAEQLVNPVSAAQLQPRNSEPTHLGGMSWDDLGGTTLNSAPNSATVNAAGSIKGQDTSIPRSVPAEPSHLTGMKAEEDESPEVEIEFGDEKPEIEEADDLDKALDEFDELPKSDIDVKSEETGDEDEKKLDEEDEKKLDEEDDEKKLDEEDDENEKDVTTESRISRRGSALNEDLSWTGFFEFIVYYAGYGVGTWLLGIVVFYGLVLSKMAMLLPSKLKAFVQECRHAYETYRTSKHLSASDIQRVTAAAKQVYPTLSPRVKALITTLSKKLEGSDLTSDSGRRMAAQQLNQLASIAKTSPIEEQLRKEDGDDEKKDMTEEDDEYEKKDMSEEDEKKDMSEEDEKKLDEEDDEKKLDEEDDEKKDIAESLKIRVKMPKTSLFESAGFNATQQKKVAAVFESAIKRTTKQVGAQIHEHYRRMHRRKLSEAKSKLESRLNDYLHVVVEEWFNANRVAVRQSLRADLAENFLNGLQSLFKEHYIDVPESKINVVKTLTQEVKSLRAQVNEQVTQKMKLRKLAEAANKKRIVAEFARTLSESQSAKLGKLAEDTSYVSAKDFREKLTMLKESYFGESRPSQVTRLPEENVQVVKETRGKSEVDVVADAISRQVKSNW